MKLYLQPGTCSSAVQIALLEARLPCEFINIELHSGRLLPDGRPFSEVTPKNYVPALEFDDGSVLTEMPAVLLYVAAHSQGTKLAPPPGDIEYFRVVEWLSFIASEVHQSAAAVKFGPSEGRARAMERLLQRFSHVDQHLESEDYLVGNQFTVADAYLFIVAHWGDFVGFDISGMENIQRFIVRVGGRESVREAMAAITD